MELLEREINETESLIGTAVFDGVKATLQAHADKLRKNLLKVQTAATAAASTAATTAADAVAPTELSPAASAAAAPQTSSKSVTGGRRVGGAAYIPIEDYSWDQGDYNSSTVTVYAELDGVGAIKDHVQVSFTPQGFDMCVSDLDGKNYRLLKDNLEKDIVPQESTFVVKKNKVILKLKKVKGEYSYEHWSSLTAKKKREESSGAKKDPMGGIMDMMKNLYEDGDDNMKKVIGEAMLKSQRGEKPDMSGV
jgi:calcyclin binding protein